MQTELIQKPAAKTKKPVFPDTIIAHCHACENLTTIGQAFTWAAAVLAADDKAFRIGGILAKVKAEQWVDDVCPSFAAFCENLGLPTSTAYDYVRVFEAVRDSGATSEQVKAAGWTKVRLLSGLGTPAEFLQRLEKAATMKRHEVAAWAAELKAADEKAAIEAGDPAAVAKAEKKALKAAVVEKAKTENEQQGGSPMSDTQALQAAQMSFLNDPAPTPLNTTKLSEIPTAADASAAPVDPEPDEINPKIAAESALIKAVVVLQMPLALRLLYKHTDPQTVLGVFAEVWPHLDLAVTDTTA